MKKSIFLATAALLITSHLLYCQNQAINPWNFVSESTLDSKTKSSEISGKNYLTARLNVEQMKDVLASAPLWHTALSKSNTVFITLPIPDGSFQVFRIEEAPVMHPDLQAKFPEIRSYVGYGVEDPSAYFRGDLTPRGFHGIIRSTNHSTILIDPYATTDIDNYIINYYDDTDKGLRFPCSTMNIGDFKMPNLELPSEKMTGDCVHRNYSIAVACSGLFSETLSAPATPTTSSMLASVNTVTTMMNGIFENEFNIHLDLHPSETSVIFLNSTTDPYSDVSDGSTSQNTLMNTNQTTCNNILGGSTYDLGILFCITGGGRVAEIGSVCSSSNKAKSCYGSSGGASFLSGYEFGIGVAHEIGHLFGAHHTYNNSCTNSSGITTRNDATAYEPGSGSTIMSYGGGCSPDIGYRDDYFHAINIKEINDYITSQSCSPNGGVGSLPTVNAGADFIIPKLTPFVLKASGDASSYCWEQMDNQIATMPPLSTNTNGPAFRSMPPVGSPLRYLPRLLEVVGGNISPTWEVLSSVNRSYNFRVTGRSGGCTSEDDMVVTVDAATGPFVVTSPNTNITWLANTNQTVTWSVAGTTGNVDILLSIDGGFNYPYTLATSTPNDGTQVIAVPYVTSTTARIMVRSNGNIFYDISDQNFTISSNFTFDVTDVASICPPANAEYKVIIGNGVVNGSVVNLSISGLPSGLTSSFSVNPVTSPGLSILTIGNTSSLSPGIYTFTVSGTDGTEILSEVVSLAIPDVPNAVVLSSPVNNALNISTNPTLNWNGTTWASSYDIQVSTSSSFTSFVVNTNVGPYPMSYTVNYPTLNVNTVYYWRVRAKNQCGGIGAYSSVYRFTTGSCSSPPIQVTLSSPTNGATGQSITPTLQWNSMGANQFVVQVATDYMYSNLVVNTTTYYPYYNVPPALDYNTTYYWRVKAVNDCGEGPFSSGSSFTTMKCTLPAQVVLSYPANGAHVPTNTVLYWSAAVGASSYDLEVANNYFYNPLIINVSGLSQNYYLVPAGILSSHQTYYWRVRAHNECGYGQYSVGRSFYTCTPGEIGCGGFKGDPVIQERNGNFDDGSESHGSSISIYPNPTNNVLVVEFSQSDAIAEIIVTDLVGRQLLIQKLESNGTGFQQTSLDVSRLQSGSYQLQLINGDRREITQFVKIGD